jgi:hypothetical protein
MKKVLAFVFIAWGLSAPLLSSVQRLEVVSTSKLKADEENMQRADETCRKADKNLEREVFSVPQEKALERIATSLARRRDFQQKRHTFLETLNDRVGEDVSSLESEPVTFHAEPSKASLKARLQVVEVASRDLQEIISGLSATDAKLRELRENLKSQEKVMDSAAATAQSLEESRQRVITAASAVLDCVATELEKSEAEDLGWTKYYESLRDSVAKVWDDRQRKEKKLASEKGQR